MLGKDFVIIRGNLVDSLIEIRYVMKRVKLSFYIIYDFITVIDYYTHYFNITTADQHYSV